MSELILGRRYYLREKEKRYFLREVAEKLNLDMTEFLNEKFEIVKERTSGHQIFLMNGKASFVKSKGEIFPSLINDSILMRLPTLTVDMGAVPHLCNGADVMAPGVVKIDGDFKAGDIIVVIDERFSKNLVICEALYDASKTSEKKNGKVARNIHYINDKFWEAFKEITSRR